MELPPTGEHNLLPTIYLHIELSAYHVLHRISCACYETSLNICSEVLCSGCGSRTTLSVGYEPPMIFEYLCFKNSYPFHSPANFRCSG